VQQTEYYVYSSIKRFEYHQKALKIGDKTEIMYGMKARLIFTHKATGL
jgi:hypothetical protein